MIDDGKGLVRPLEFGLMEPVRKSNWMG